MNIKLSATLKVLLPLWIGCLPLTVSANAFLLPDQDAFATARGEAFAATADNPSAIYYNPAGITQLDGQNLRMGLYGIYYNPSFTPPAPANTNTFHIENKFAAIPQFYYAFTPEKPPANLPLSFGLGVYAPFGLGVEWPQNTGFRSVATKGSVQYVTINPVVALKLGPTLSIGGGLTVNYGNVDLEQGLYPVQSGNDQFRFNGDGWGVGFNLGLRWQPIEKVSFGASFRSGTKMNLNGQTETIFPPFVTTPTFRSAQATFSFPLIAIMGVSYRPTPKWNFECDANCTDWSSVGTLTIRQSSSPIPGIIPQNAPVVLDWQRSWLFELGGTRYLAHGWQVSAGYVYNENSVPDLHYSPVVADLNRHFFSVGTGFKGKIFSFDVAYQFGYGPARTVTGSAPSLVGQTANGTYDWFSQTVLVTVGVHF